MSGNQSLIEALKALEAEALGAISGAGEPEELASLPLTNVKRLGLISSLYQQKSART